MFLHLGGGETVFLRDVIAVFNLENTQPSKITKEFLKEVQEVGLTKKITEEQPKSFILAEVNNSYIIYYSPISSHTLLKRMEHIERSEQK